MYLNTSEHYYVAKLYFIFIMPIQQIALSILHACLAVFNKTFSPSFSKHFSNARLTSRGQLKAARLQVLEGTG